MPNPPSNHTARNHNFCGTFIKLNLPSFLHIKHLHPLDCKGYLAAALEGSSRMMAGETAERIICLKLHYFFALNRARYFARRFGTMAHGLSQS